MFINIRDFLTGTVYLSSGASNASSGLSNSFEGLFNVFLVIYVAVKSNIVLSLNKRLNLIEFLKTFPVIFWIVFLIYLVLRLLSGDRGPVMYNLLLMVYAYTILSRKLIKLTVTVPIIAVSAILITFMGLIRSRDTSMSFLEKIHASVIRYDELRATSVPTISPPTAELAHSILCNYIAIRDVESETTNYKLGSYTYISLFSSFPGAKRSYFYGLGLEDSDFSSANYITESYNRSKSYDYGLGTSVLAESYLDGGIYGIMIVAIICGWIFKNIDMCFIDKKNISVPYLIMTLKIASLSLYLSRSSLSLTLGNLIYIFIIYIVINSFTKLCK